jgi:hypothetical protein
MADLQSAAATTEALAKSVLQARGADRLPPCLPASPDLTRVVVAWPTLPEHVRLAILALIDGSLRKG